MFKVVIGGLFLLVLLYFVRLALIPFIIGFFLSYVLEPPVSFLQGKGISRRTSILLVYLIVLVLSVALLTYFIPKFLLDLKDMTNMLPTYSEKARSLMGSLSDSFRKFNLPFVFDKSLANAVSRIESSFSSIGDNIIDYAFGSMTFITYLILSPVIAYYILRDINTWRHKSFFALSRYPLPYVDLVRDIDRVLSGFIRGQSIVALCVMVLVFIAASLLGLKYAAFLALIGGLGEFVPYFGPIVAAVPTILVAFLKSPYTAFWALSAIIIIQWFDSNILVPRVTGEKVGLGPLWMIFSLLAFEEIFGFWGIFLAVPLAGITKSLLVCAWRLVTHSPKPERK